MNCKFSEPPTLNQNNTMKRIRKKQNPTKFCVRLQKTYRTQNKDRWYMYEYSIKFKPKYTNWCLYYNIGANASFCVKILTFFLVFFMFWISVLNSFESIRDFFFFSATRMSLKHNTRFCVAWSLRCLLLMLYVCTCVRVSFNTFLENHKNNNNNKSITKYLCRSFSPPFSSLKWKCIQAD